MKIHGIEASGNCYKPCLLLAHLGRGYRWVSVDALGGQTRSERFRAMNPHGKTPVLELDDGRFLFESNAMLCYLAEGTEYLPSDAWQRARTLAWMFFEQNSLETPIGTPRFWKVVMHDEARYLDEFARRRTQCVASLAAMERHLGGVAWFGDERMTVADIALYAYAHLAPEAGYDLAPFPRVRAWLDRVRAQPGHLRMADMAAGRPG